MLFDFMLNPRMLLALARRRRGADRSTALRASPTLPAMAQWATFLRNHDEIDLCRLTTRAAERVFAAFGPTAGHAALRPGHPPPAGADAGRRPARIELAYSLQFTLPGTPVLRYGEEIGMGEDLSLPGPRRDPYADAVGARPNGGLLHGGAEDWFVPTVLGASSAPSRSTCTLSERDPGSLLAGSSG